MSQVTPASAAPSGGQPAGTATPPTHNPPPADHQPTYTPNYAPAPAPHLQYLLDTTRNESISRKKKLQAERQARTAVEAEKAALLAENAALKAEKAAHEEKLKAAAEQQVETALLTALKGKGIDEAQAKLLIPSVRKHAEFDAKTGEIKLKEEDLAATIAPFAKPGSAAAPTTRATALHRINTASHAPPATAPPPLTLQERIKLRAEEILAARG